VGVGQSELAISAAADTTLVVVTPDMGDAIQTMKAGILEIADLFALNKADQAGARQALHALRAMLHRRQADPWTIPIVQTEAHQALGLEQLWDRIQEHRRYQEDTGVLRTRRARQARAEIHDLVEHELRTQTLDALTHGPRFDTLVGEVLAHRQDPLHAARLVLADAPHQPPMPNQENNNG